VTQRRAPHPIRTRPSGSAMSRRTFLATAGSAAGLATMNGLWPGTAARAASSTDNTSLVMGESLVIRSLDPGHTLEPDGLMVCHAAYDSLVTFAGADLSTPRPSLATGWKVSGDGLVYTFTLRPGVRFASGNALTSADVKWSFERVINLKSNPAFFLANVEEVQAPDPLTIVLRLKTPQPAIIPILSSPALGIIDSKVVAANGGDAGPNAKSNDHAESYLMSHSAGSGAFILTSYTPNQEVVLVRNPHHWRGPAHMERVVIRSIPEASAEALQLERGDLHIAAGIDQQNAQTLRSVPGVTVRESPIAASYLFMVNQDPQISGPLAHPKVIQAIRYALDYDGILAIAGAGATRMAGVIPNILPGALDPREAIKTNRAMASRLVKESGLGAIKGRLEYPSDSISYGVSYALLAQKIQSDLAAVGITLALDGLPGAVELGDYRGGRAPALFGGYLLDYPDATDFLVYLPGRLVGNRLHWPASSSPAAQELARWGDEADQEGDAKKRVALLQKIQRRLIEIGPYAPMFTPAQPYGFRSDLTGVTFSSVWKVDFSTIRRA
jgi:peptide/nickel transport system substrate-binding protein